MLQAVKDNERRSNLEDTLHGKEIGETSSMKEVES